MSTAGEGRLASMWNKFLGRTARGRHSRRMLRRPLRLERLEGRQMMAALVGEIAPGAGDGVPVPATAYTTLDNELYFFGSAVPVNSSNCSLDIYKATPGRSGVTKVAELGSIPGANPDSLTASGGKLYFAHTTSSGGRELWSSDKAGRLARVKDIHPQGSSLPSQLTDVNGILYFVATDGQHGLELWRSNGTSDGTFMITDVWTGFGVSADPRNLVVAGGKLFFTARDGSGRGLWVTNGTASGTQRLTSLDDQTDACLTNVNGTLYFAGKDPQSRFTTELWRSDGTVVGTRMVIDLSTRTGATPAQLTAVGERLFFSADVPEAMPRLGRELYVYDTRTGTARLVKNLAPDLPQVGAAYSSNPEQLTNVNGRLFFSASDNSTSNNSPVGHGRELYVSDGTEAGTRLVKDIKPGGPTSSDSAPRNLTAVGSVVFFTADDGQTGRELWRSDGTVAGTYRVQDIYPGVDAGRTPYSSDPQDLRRMGDVLFFNATNNVTGRELWWESIPRLSIGDVTATEGNSGMKAFSFPVTLSVAATQTVQVTLSTVLFAGLPAATPGSDFLPATNVTLTFAPGVTLQYATVWVYGDNVREASEVFGIQIFAASGGGAGLTIQKCVAKGTILNDDL